MRRSAPPLAWLSCLLAMACQPPTPLAPTQPGPDDTADPPGTTDTDDPPTPPTTTDTGTPPAPVALSAPEVVYGVPNVDNAVDWVLWDPTDDDIVAFEVTPSNDPDARNLVLSVSDGTLVRIWLADTLLLDVGQTEAEVPWQQAPIALGVEFGEFDVDVTLTIDEVDATGSVLDSVEVRLRAGPMFLNHHLQDSELVVVMDVDGFGWNNQAMVAAMSAELGGALAPFDDNAYDYDVWVQDEIEFAWGTTPDGLRMDLVVDSVRDRGLDDYPEETFQGEDFAVRTYGNVSPFQVNSLDSFGNLEVTPPIDGFPNGRIYYGGDGNYVPADDVLYDYLEAMGLQDPLMVDSTWLCVGHVDEWMSFVPDATAPRGFRFVYTDTALAWTLLEGMDPATPLPRYAGSRNHNYDTVGELLGDIGLRNENDDLQAEHLTPILDQLTAEWGLTSDEIVLIPGLFETASFCGGGVAALIPGMANLTAVNIPGDTPRVFMADPFIRSDLTDQSSDPFIADVRARLPQSDVIFLDDWETYHLALGEVHCGTNVLRTPAYEWWLDDGGAP